MIEGESTCISENSKWSIQKRFQNGTFKLSYLPYGYDWNGKQMIINPEQTEIVRWIFSQVLSDKDTQAIANEPNDKGIPTKRGARGKTTTNGGIITNKKTTGDVFYKKPYPDPKLNRHVLWTKRAVCACRSP